MKNYSPHSNNNTKVSTKLLTRYSRSVAVLLPLSILVFFACRKEQPDMRNSKDPCKCASEVSADFVIEELATHIPEEIWIETDTSLHNKTVQFRALEEDAEYQWYIGIDQFETQTASRYFSDEWIGSDIPITLVVKKDPNKACFPNDDGYDSITKTFYVSQYPIYHGYDEDIELGTIEGTYRVYSDELGDSIDITFDAEQWFDRRSANIYNTDGSGIVCEKNSRRSIKYISYREVALERGGDFVSTNNICDGLQGVIKNHLNKPAELIFETGFYDEEEPNYEKKFHYFGRKLKNH